MRCPVLPSPLTCALSPCSASQSLRPPPWSSLHKGKGDEGWGGSHIGPGVLLAASPGGARKWPCGWPWQGHVRPGLPCWCPSFGPDTERQGLRQAVPSLGLELAMVRGSCWTFPCGHVPPLWSSDPLEPHQASPGAHGDVHRLVCSNNSTIGQGGQAWLGRAAHGPRATSLCRGRAGGRAGGCRKQQGQLGGRKGHPGRSAPFGDLERPRQRGGGRTREGASGGRQHGRGWPVEPGHAPPASSAEFAESADLLSPQARLGRDRRELAPGLGRC